MMCNAIFILPLAILLSFQQGVMAWTSTITTTVLNSGTFVEVVYPTTSTLLGVPITRTVTSIFSTISTSIDPSYSTFTSTATGLFGITTYLEGSYVTTSNDILGLPHTYTVTTTFSTLTSISTTTAAITATTLNSYATTSAVSFTTTLSSVCNAVTVTEREESLVSLYSGPNYVSYQYLTETDQNTFRAYLYFKITSSGYSFTNFNLFDLSLFASDYNAVVDLSSGTVFITYTMSLANLLTCLTNQWWFTLTSSYVTYGYYISNVAIVNGLFSDVIGSSCTDTTFANCILEIVVQDGKGLITLVSSATSPSIAFPSTSLSLSIPSSFTSQSTIPSSDSSSDSSSSIKSSISSFTSISATIISSSAGSPSISSSSTLPSSISSIYSTLITSSISQVSSSSLSNSASSLPTTLITSSLSPSSSSFHSTSILSIPSTSITSSVSLSSTVPSGSVVSSSISTPGTSSSLQSTLSSFSSDVTSSYSSTFATSSFSISSSSSSYITGTLSSSVSCYSLSSPISSSIVSSYQSTLVTSSHITSSSSRSGSGRSRNEIYLAKESMSLIIIKYGLCIIAGLLII